LTRERVRECGGTGGPDLKAGKSVLSKSNLGGNRVKKRGEAFAAYDEWSGHHTEKDKDKNQQVSR